MIGGLGALPFLAAFALAGDAGVRPLLDVPARPERWYPLLVEDPAGAGPEGIEVRSASGRSLWRVDPLGAGTDAMAAVFPGQDSAAIVGSGDSRETHVLPPAIEHPLALVLGSGGEAPVRERGFRVFQREGTAVPLDPIVLDPFDLVSISESWAAAAPPGAAERIRACAEAGARFQVDRGAARRLFGARAPSGILLDVPSASGLSPPLRPRDGAPSPAPVRFGEVRSAAGAFVVGWAAIGLAILAARGIPRRIRAALPVLLGAAGTLAATWIPLPLDEPLGIVHVVLLEGRCMRARLAAAPGVEDLSPLDLGSIPRPAAPDGRVEIAVEGGRRTARLSGRGIVVGGPPPRGLERDPDSGSILDPFGAIGAGAWLRDGVVVGPTPPVERGRPVPRTERPGRLDRSVTAFLELLGPRPGWVFVARLPRGRDPEGARWLVADVGED